MGSSSSLSRPFISLKVQTNAQEMMPGKGCWAEFMARWKGKLLLNGLIMQQRKKERVEWIWTGKATKDSHYHIFVALSEREHLQSHFWSNWFSFWRCIYISPEIGNLFSCCLLNLAGDISNQTQTIWFCLLSLVCFCSGVNAQSNCDADQQSERCFRKTGLGLPQVNRRQVG